MNGTENIIAWMLPRGIQYVMVAIRIDGELVGELSLHDRVEGALIRLQRAALVDVA